MVVCTTIIPEWLGPSWPRFGTIFGAVFEPRDCSGATVHCLGAIFAAILEFWGPLGGVIFNHLGAIFG